nr:tape measure protein [uncultured Rhodoferax sp.]
MSEKVGEIYYDVTLETAQLIDGQRKVKRELDSTSKSLDGFGLKLTSVARAVGVLGAAMAALKAAQLADDIRMLGAKIEVAAGSMEAGASAMAALEAISKRTQTSMAASSEVFVRLNQSLIQMGGTQQDTLNLTELLGKAIKISGASAAEGASAMTQFGQALGSGTLAGDELKSLLENAPYLMGKLAQGLDVPIGALKKMGEEGKLTADVVTNALNKAATQIDEDFKKFPQTISSAMDVAQDAAGRLSSKMDELTGTSAALTGVVQGTGTVLDELAKQFAAANDQAGTLGRNTAIASWAEGTKYALSYVVDAADIVWQTLSVLGRNVSYVFESIRDEVGGIGAQIAAVARGDFEQARAIHDMMVADSEARRAALDEADRKTLSRAKTAGAEMREAWKVGAGGGRGSANPPVSEGSTLRAPIAATSGGKTKSKGSTAKEFDAEGYLAGLEKSTVSALDAIDIAEQEAIRKNDELLKNKNITFEQHQAARTMILANAQQERDELEAKAEQKRKADYIKHEEEALRDSKAKQDAINMANAILIENDPAAKIRATYAAREAALQEGRMREFLGEDLQNKAIIANRDSMNKALADLDQQRIDKQLAAQSQMFQGTSQLFGNLADLAKQGAGEQSDIYKTMFAASKAFAIADSIIKIQQGVANAAALPFPTNLGAMATVVASTAGLISTISSTNLSGGRQYGGAVNSGNLYRVNEKGAPEMFTAANGSQYMMPTASGRVTAADQVGSGALKLTIINNTRAPIGEVAERNMGNNERALIINEAVGAVAAQMGDPNSQVSRSMSRNFNSQRSR